MQHKAMDPNRTYRIFRLSDLKTILDDYVRRIEFDEIGNIPVRYHQPRKISGEAIEYLINCAIGHIEDLLELSQDRINPGTEFITKGLLQQTRFRIDDIGNERREQARERQEAEDQERERTDPEFRTLREDQRRQRELIRREQRLGELRSSNSMARFVRASLRHSNR